jgi:hypothetical protein
MVLPRWIPFVVAAWVIAFGILRLRIAFSKDEEDDKKPNYRRRGLYGRSKRSHGVLGALYVLMGCYLVAMGFGFQPDLLGACSAQESAPTESKTDSEAVPVNVTK